MDAPSAAAAGSPPPPFTVVTFAGEPRYAAAFRAINLHWIETFFRVEPHDEATLSDPAALLAAGGHILLAVAAGGEAAAGVGGGGNDDGDDPRVLGVVALLRPAAHGEGMELAKMGVREGVRGRGVGRALGAAVVALASSLRTPRVDILSNRRLGPALALYRSLGFVEQPLPPNDYERADIYLVLELASSQ